MTKINVPDLLGDIHKEFPLAYFERHHASPNPDQSIELNAYADASLLLVLDKELEGKMVFVVHAYCQYKSGKQNFELENEYEISESARKAIIIAEKHCSEKGIEFEPNKKFEYIDNLKRKQSEANKKKPIIGVNDRPEIFVNENKLVNSK